jgi:gamma-polyglutamate biosynthesis protein CapA
VREVRLGFVGDIMCGDSFFSLGSGVGSGIDRFGSEYLSAPIQSLFHQHDVVLGNIEGAISDVGRVEWSMRRRHMRGRGSVAGLLKQWGISIAHVANNHILEQGYPAAVDTVMNLKKAEIQVVGAGESDCFKGGLDVLRIDVDSSTFAFLAVCLRDEKYAYHWTGAMDAIDDAIRKCKSQGAFVTVSVHWGDEFIDRPNRNQIELADQWMSSGADLIVGHHPHVVQGMEWREGRLVAYSLGNFLFDHWFPDTQWSLMLSVRVREGRIGDWEAIPFRRGQDHRPELVMGKEKESTLAELERRNRCFAAWKEDAYSLRYSSDLEHLEQAARTSLHRIIRENWLRIPPVFWPQLVFRPIQRRLGVW